MRVRSSISLMMSSTVASLLMPVSSSSWRPLETSFILSVDRSRNDSIRSPSINPSQGSTLRSVAKLRQKLCSILPPTLPSPSALLTKFKNYTSGRSIWESLLAGSPIRNRLRFIFYRIPYQDGLGLRIMKFFGRLLE